MELIKKNLSEAEQGSAVDSLGQGMPASKRETEEDLLEAFCQWRKSGVPVTTDAACQQFGLGKRQLNTYLRHMVQHGYLEELDGTGILQLTEFGKYRGDECSRRHEYLAQLLEVIGMERMEAEDSACRIEHFVSDKVIERIGEFLNYGGTYERNIMDTDLSSRYEPGEYTFSMGIYRLERRYPRELAVGYESFEDRVTLVVDGQESHFVLEKKVSWPYGELWYKEPKGGWRQAAPVGRGEGIPTRAFTFTVIPSHPIIEGVVLIAYGYFGNNPPTEEECWELNVDIW